MSLKLLIVFAYSLVGWLVFWLPLRQMRLAAFCFLPGVILAFGLPGLVSDVHFSPPPVFRKDWGVLPFCILLIERIGHAVIRARHDGSDEGESTRERR